jgi:hypothetical protein
LNTDEQVLCQLGDMRHSRSSTAVTPDERYQLILAAS